MGVEVTSKMVYQWIPIVGDDLKSGAVGHASSLATIQAGLVATLAGVVRVLPFERGKVRLTGWIPLDRLAYEGHFRGRLFRGVRGIVWDASTLPDVMTRSMFWSGS